MTNLRHIFDIHIKKNASRKACKHWEIKNNLFFSWIIEINLHIFVNETKTKTK